jgi:hypothetical protein
VDKKNEKKQPIPSSTEINTLKQKEIENINIEKTRKKSEKLAICSKTRELDDDFKESDNDYIDLTSCVSSHKKIKIEDFNLVKLVGKGSFGKVCFQNISLCKISI